MKIYYLSLVSYFVVWKCNMHINYKAEKERADRVCKQVDPSLEFFMTFIIHLLPFLLLLLINIIVIKKF